MVLSPLPTARADVRRSLVSADGGGLDLGPPLARPLAQLAPPLDVVLGLVERVLADLAAVHDAGQAHGALEVEGFGFDASGVFFVRPSVLRPAPVGAPRESDVQAIGAVVGALVGDAPRLKFWLRGTGATESRVAFRDARAARQALLAVIGRGGVDAALKQWLTAVGGRLPGPATPGWSAARAAPAAGVEAAVVSVPGASADDARRWVEGELARLRAEESTRVSREVREHRGMTDRLKLRVRQSVDPAQLRAAPASLVIAPVASVAVANAAVGSAAVASVLPGGAAAVGSAPAEPVSVLEPVRLSIPGIRVARVEPASVAEIVEVVPAEVVESWADAPVDDGTEETSLPLAAAAALVEEEPDDDLEAPAPPDVPRPPSAVLVAPPEVESAGPEVEAQAEVKGGATPPAEAQAEVEAPGVEGTAPEVEQAEGEASGVESPGVEQAEAAPGGEVPAALESPDVPRPPSAVLAHRPEVEVASPPVEAHAEVEGGATPPVEAQAEVEAPGVEGTAPEVEHAEGEASGVESRGVEQAEAAPGGEVPAALESPDVPRPPSAVLAHRPEVEVASPPVEAHAEVEGGATPPVEAQAEVEAPGVESAEPEVPDVPGPPSAVSVDPSGVTSAAPEREASPPDRPPAPLEPWAALAGLPASLPLAGSAASLPPLRPATDPAPAPPAAEAPPVAPAPPAAEAPPVAPSPVVAAHASGPVATEPTPRDTRWLLPEEGTEVRLTRPGDDDVDDGVVEASAVLPRLADAAPPTPALADAAPAMPGFVDRVDREALLAARRIQAPPPPPRPPEPARGPVLTPRPDGIEEPGDVFVRPAGVDSGPAWGGAVGVTQNSDRAHEKGPGKWTESGRDAEELASHLPAGPSRPLRLDDPAPSGGMGWVVVGILALLGIVAAVAFWPS